MSRKKKYRAQSARKVCVRCCPRFVFDLTSATHPKNMWIPWRVEAIICWKAPWGPAPLHRRKRVRQGKFWQDEALAHLSRFTFDKRPEKNRVFCLIWTLLASDFLKNKIHLSIWKFGRKIPDNFEKFWKTIPKIAWRKTFELFLFMAILGWWKHDPFKGFLSPPTKSKNPGLNHVYNIFVTFLGGATQILFWIFTPT